MNTALDQLIETELDRPEIRGVTITEDSLIVNLRDGRTIVAPLLWYPRLAYAADAERQDFEIRRNVIYWPRLDEEVSVRAMLLGRTSGESPQSLERWLAQRQTESAAVRASNGSAGTAT